MESLSQQLYAFALTILAGVSFGFVFDIYRVVRGIIKPGPINTSLMDLVFWLIVTPVTITYILLANWGELRFYVFIGLGLGVGFYAILLSKAIISLLLWVTGMISGLVGLIISIAVGLLALPISLVQDVAMAVQGRRVNLRHRKPFFKGRLRWKSNLFAFRRK